MFATNKVRVFFATALLALSSSAVFAYDFNGKIKTEIKSLSGAKIGDSIQLVVTDAKVNDELEPYPIGTVFSGTFVEHRGRRRISRNEILKAKITTATLPSGKVEQLNKVIKIVPRHKRQNIQWAGNTALATAGGVLSLTADTVTLGLPISRGGLAVWTAIHEVNEREEGASRWKAAGGGFLKGAFMPVSMLVLKGDPLNLETGSIVYIGKDRGPEKYIRASKVRS